MKHILKIEKSYFDAIMEGSKTFEVRFNDRGYQKGDLVQFRIITHAGFIDNQNEFEITYVFHSIGLRDGFCVFGIKKVSMK